MWPTMPAVLSMAGVMLAISSAVSAFLSVPIVRNPNASRGQPHRLLRRDTWEQTLINNLTGGFYSAQVAVGTPPQDVTLVLDTGSSDTWVLDRNADLCVSRQAQEAAGVGGCIQTYDKSESSSYELVGRNDFSITYLSGETSMGDYIREDFHIGGTTIESLQMGLALSTQINSGIIGVGFGNLASYPNIMDEFKAQGLIETMAYSLWLNDISSDTGSILFGAIDSEKYIGSIDVIPILPSRDNEFYHFQVVMSSFTVASPSNAFETFGVFRGQLVAILDSGTTLSYLPSGIVNELYEAIGAIDDTFRTGAVFISCSILDDFPDLEFTFTFASADDDTAATISVPLREMVLDNVRPFLRQGYTLPPDIPFADDSVCSLGLQAIDGGGAASGSGQIITDLALLGATFLRSAYAVYDLDNREIGLAQANLNATGSNIVEITDGIPVRVTGVESQAPFTATDATGSVSTVTIGAGENDDGTENATVPTLDARALWISGVVGAVVMLWMGLGASVVLL